MNEWMRKKWKKKKKKEFLCLGKAMWKKIGSKKTDYFRTSFSQLWGYRVCGGEKIVGTCIMLEQLI